MCIGPYAQANVVDGSIIYVAGQIPLNPATMKIVDSLRMDENLGNLMLLVMTHVVVVVVVGLILFVVLSSLPYPYNASTLYCSDSGMFPPRAEGSRSFRFRPQQRPLLCRVCEYVQVSI